MSVSISMTISNVKRRLKNGLRLTEKEEITLTKVKRRIQNALEKNKGIKLSAKELKTLGIYGLAENPCENSLDKPKI